ncbi:hypothetical protein HAX54_044401 [Datura stramonium]|uniref:Uncharacterized protein n=1 Tax=Datura stramonium TaxID=4076 RepID=A0ABS8SQN9_DATST|nr:hypothetical protein [Datura stramonium]
MVFIIMFIREKPDRHCGARRCLSLEARGVHVKLPLALREPEASMSHSYFLSRWKDTFVNDPNPPWPRRLAAENDSHNKRTKAKAAAMKGGMRGGSECRDGGRRVVGVWGGGRWWERQEGGQRREIGFSEAFECDFEEPTMHICSETYIGMRGKLWNNK